MKHGIAFIAFMVGAYYLAFEGTPILFWTYVFVVGGGFALWYGN